MRGQNVAQKLLQRESGGGHRAELQQAASQHFIDRQPALWQEQEITGKLASALSKPLDKAFAAAWQDDHRLLVGTKSNDLLQWDTTAGTVRSIPLPAPPPRQHSILETVWGACGIHSVTVNPAGDMVATGGAEPADCTVLRLPDFAPVQTLVGHIDWVFAAAWVSDRHVVTGSRDQTVALWSIPDCDSGAPAEQYKGMGTPDGLHRKFAGKVRDVKYDFDSCRLAALSTEGCVKLLDTTRNLRATRTIELTYNKELVCMEQQHDLVAVGSMGHVTLIDPRRRAGELRAVASPDNNEGVRSVQLTQHLLSFGTGRGQLFFYDLRANAFLPTQPVQPPEDCVSSGFFGGGSQHGGLPQLLQQPAVAAAPAVSVQPPPCHLQLGDGLVVHNETYYSHFHGMVIKHACYAHIWDASHSRLFVCGGPLAFGLQGLYLSVWH
ncbi:hypothetical protein D9Q98_006965 [Chlorella vulgaris]|uniref:DDB1- and CUL4-associated factor 12 beta-propeller domain-containing protein n=1 Tax=Chlorella vulgaris TaxID=3077 RepID=A0A9D4YUK3_CHLVU|nr:hypothetical protein D9Q98_006965 [Chlorella vulgaris]